MTTVDESGSRRAGAGPAAGGEGASLVFAGPGAVSPPERVEPDERSDLYLAEPLPYLPFVALMDRATLILTDSGGVQEEAPSLGKPVLVMRETTERLEAVEAGTAKLVGTDQRAIVEEATRLLTDREAYKAMARAHNPYGDGKAAGRIADACSARLALNAGSS